MKMMKKLAMSLALGLGLLGGGQGMGATRSQSFDSLENLKRVKAAQPYAPQLFVQENVLFEEPEVYQNADTDLQDADILRELYLNSGLYNCGNILVAHADVPYLGRRYIFLQSGLDKTVSTRFRDNTCRWAARSRRGGDALRRGLIDQTVVFDGADVIGMVSEAQRVQQKQIAADIRTLAGGRGLTGRGRTDQEQDADVRERLEDVILALQIYVAKCQTAGFTARPNWARRTDGHGITKVVDVNYDPFRLNWEASREWMLRYFEKLNQQSKMNVLMLMLQHLHSGRGTDYNPQPRNGYLPQSFADDCTRFICNKTGIDFNSQDAYKIYNFLRWFRYALHTEIQLALLTHLEEGQKATLVPHSPILSLKDPCPSCEQGANSAWDHQQHKFFSIQGDKQGKNHEFSTDQGTIIQMRYCTWK